MAKNEIMTNVTRTLGKIELKAKKYSPEILVVAGVVGVVTSAVMACKATTKASAITDELKNNMDQIHQVAEQAKNSDAISYTEEDLKKDTAIVYAQTGVKFVKLYGPSIALGAVSIACILGGHHILRKRNIAIAAAYTAVKKDFKNYRGNVIERFGEALDRELKYNIKTKEIEEVIVDENGNEKIVTKTVEEASPIPGEYTKCFDEYCRGWTKDAEFNLMFLRRQQDHANELLKSKGYLYLNDVYEMLGIDATKAGTVVGWVINENNPDCHGYIDFGIYNLYNEGSRDFVNGRERSIWLDFNVDGVVHELFEDR